MPESSLIMTLASDWQKVRGTNTTDPNFPARFASATRPAGIGNDVVQSVASAVIDKTNGQAGGAAVQNAILIMPYGVGADNNTGSVRVYGWSKVPDQGTPDTETWICILLAEFAYTVSATNAGIGSRKIGSTALFADTITVTYGNAGIDNDAVSPANDLPAHAVVDLKGCEVIEITFKTGSSLTSCNALARLL